jgi:hypothetical protein
VEIDQAVSDAEPSFSCDQIELYDAIEEIISLGGDLSFADIVDVLDALDDEGVAAVLRGLADGIEEAAADVAPRPLPMPLCDITDAMDRYRGALGAGKPVYGEAIKAALWMRGVDIVKVGTGWGWQLRTV